MPITVEGVEKHVKKLYSEQQLLMRSIELQIREVLGSEAGRDLLDEISELRKTSQDLGSMRRLLGDLRAAEARKGTIDPRP